MIASVGVDGLFALHSVESDCIVTLQQIIDPNGSALTHVTFLGDNQVLVANDCSAMHVFDTKDISKPIISIRE